VKKTLETKPQLIQISAAWNSREGAPLGRNQYVELEIKKAEAKRRKHQGIRSFQKPCEKMTEAIVMDGGKRGQVVKVCADPACRTHHPNTPSPQQVERERAEERKRIEKGETGHHDSPSCLGHDPPTRIGSVKESRLAARSPIT
jgi:ParB family chromosome partitioning protein